MRFAAVVVSLLLVASVSAQDAPEETPFVRKDVTAVADQLACYCGCPHMQVSTCFCGTADSIREDIAAQLDAGRTAEQVVAAYVEEHGTWGLAVPPKEGFNLVIWVLPAALLIGGAVLVFILGARWSRRSDDDEAAAASDEAIDPARRDELDRLLREED